MKLMNRLLKSDSPLLLMLILLAISRLIYFSAWLVFEHRSASGSSIGDFCQYDCNWYLTIIKGGYMDAPLITGHVGAANWAFFPVFPFTVRVLSLVLNINPVLVGIILNNLLYPIFVYMTVTYLKIKFPSINRNYIIFFFAFTPFSIYINSLYTETLYITLLSAILLLLEKQKWVFVGLLGILISGTRVTGALMIVLVLIKLYEVRGEGGQQIVRKVSSVLFFPSGLLAFMVYLHFKTGDFLAFKTIQKAWGFGDLSFMDWINKVATSNSLTQWGYLLTLIAALLISLAFLKRGAFSEFAVLAIPFAISVQSVAINYRYFYVLYPYAILLAFAMNTKFIRFFVIVALPASMILVEWAWLNGAGYLV